MTSTKPILISGGGLASLLLGKALLRHGIPFEIFERDAGIDLRGQGYRLRLSSEGLDAIESVLDPPSFEHFFEKCGKTGGGGLQSFNAVTGELIEHKVAEPITSREGKVVGIARGDMRMEFMRGCEEHVHWSKHIKGYELTEHGVHGIFSDGSKTVEGSILIGGDGLRSEIAKQVSGGKLVVYDTEARGIHGQASTKAFKGLGEGVFRISDDSQPAGTVGIITNVRPGDMNDPNIQFGWTMIGQPGVIKAPNDNYAIVGQTAADLAKSLTAKWNDRFRPLFEEMNVNEAAFWKITCSTPSGVPVWPNVERVTVIGDAAHSMTPAGGIGANTAVRDSALLGRLLGEARGFRPGLTEEYEREMRTYASEAVKASHDYMQATLKFGKLTKTLK
ncbi:MAG: hypothetical protein TREMPRED_004576 [Tremellales sp. Tagirdzhanova-0007]|nr:MAG: hypothetical protein TREMPRED_004576 [Tremellales sp. Tagirdzhanova-0007]